jgi:hypothetical protein
VLGPADADRFQVSVSRTCQLNAKTTPHAIRNAAKAPELHQTPIQQIKPGRRREFHPSYVSVFNRAGGAKLSGGGVGAPELFHVPPNLGGQYQSRRKTCQEEIVKKSQNVRCKSQRLSICSGCVAERLSTLFSKRRFRANQYTTACISAF